MILEILHCLEIKHAQRVRKLHVTRNFHVMATGAPRRIRQTGHTGRPNARPPHLGRRRLGPVRPAGSASLVQSIFADDYRGATVRFSGEIRTEPLTEQAGLRLEILRHWWRTGQPREDHGITVAGGRPNWDRHEITARIPDDADIIRFGIMLTGAGSIAVRHPELRVAKPARSA
jgi:hypothetical protein